MQAGRPLQNGPPFFFPDCEKVLACAQVACLSVFVMKNTTTAEVSAALATLKKEQGYRTLNRLFDLHKAMRKEFGDYDLDCLTAEDLAMGNIFTQAEAEALLFVISDSGRDGNDVSHLDQMLKFGWSSR